MATTATVDGALMFDGDADDGDPGLCGPYNEDDWANAMRYIAVDDFIADRGVYKGAGNELDIEAVPAAQQIYIKTGAAAVNGTLVYVTATKTLDVPANALGATRYDRVVLRINLADATESAELAILTGSTSAYAALTQNAPPDDIWEIPLWKIETPNGFSDLTGVDFIDDRRWANLSSVAAPVLINNSGADLPAGSVVVIDTGGAGLVTTTTTAFNPAVTGVLAEAVPAGNSGKVAVSGVVTVRVTGAVAIGNYLVSSTTAGAAQACTYGGFAIALSTNASGLGTVEARLIEKSWFIGLSATRGALTVPDASETALSWTEITDTINMFSSGSTVTLPFAGLWRIEAHIGYSVALGNGNGYLKVLAGGTSYLMYYDFINGVGSPASLAIVKNFSASDTVIVYAYQDNDAGSSWTLNGAYLIAQYLGGGG